MRRLVIGHFLPSCKSSACSLDQAHETPNGRRLLPFIDRDAGCKHRNSRAFPIPGAGVEAGRQPPASRGRRRRLIHTLRDPRRTLRVVRQRREELGLHHQRSAHPPAVAYPNRCVSARPPARHHDSGRQTLWPAKWGPPFVRPETQPGQPGPPVWKLEFGPDDQRFWPVRALPHLHGGHPGVPGPSPGAHGPGTRAHADLAGGTGANLHCSIQEPNLRQRLAKLGLRRQNRGLAGLLHRPLARARATFLSHRGPLGTTLKSPYL